jgi:hypothetical protein
LRHDDVPEIGDHAEVARVQLEIDILAGSGLQMDPLKSAKRAARRADDIGEL